jgi:flagellar biosynthesis protein FliQ
MSNDKLEKIEKEAKQIGLDIVIGLVILSLVFGFALGILVN